VARLRERFKLSQHGRTVEERMPSLIQAQRAPAASTSLRWLAPFQ
jgi:hypothetical protein